MRTLIASFKMLLFVLWMLLCVPLQAFVLLFHKGRGAYFIPQIWHKGVCLIFGIHLERRGTPYTAHQTIYVGNHMSYLDIPVIGTTLPASFLSKNDVKKWPVWGLLAELQQTEYIDRSAARTKSEAQNLNARITTGRNLIIFPEGTTGSGETVLPFKSSLFSLLLGGNPDLRIQPMTLELQETDGRPPVSQADRELYAWLVSNEAPLHVHLWRFAKSRGAKLTLTFHAPLLAAAYTDRKILASDCHDSVSKGLTRAGLSQAA